MYFSAMYRLCIVQGVPPLGGVKQFSDFPASGR